MVSQNSYISLFTDLILKLLEFSVGVLKIQRHFGLLLHICHLVAKMGNCRLTPSDGSRGQDEPAFPQEIPVKAQTVNNTY